MWPTAARLAPRGGAALSGSATAAAMRPPTLARALAARRPHSASPASPTWLARPFASAPAATAARQGGLCPEEFWEAVQEHFEAGPHGFNNAQPAPAVPMRTITMVKKLMPDGTACRKCNDIQTRLEKDGLDQHSAPPPRPLPQPPRNIQCRTAANGLCTVAAVDSVLYMDGNSGGVDEGTKIAMEHGVKVRSRRPRPHFRPLTS